MTENIAGGLNDTLDTVSKTLGGVGSSILNGLKRYWYVPVIVGGVIIGYKVLNKNQMANLIAALAAKN